MKRLLVLAVAVAFCSAAATATDLDVTVETVGSSTVPPDSAVDYQVIGKLSDSANEGLALVGLDLEFDGGDLAQANAPTELPMSNFVIPDGLTNPAGYGGTVQTGNLIQCGGGQNTIMNGQKVCNDSTDCPLGSDCIGGPPGICEPVATFPVGTVFTSVAQPSSCTTDSDCPMDTTVCRSGTCWQILVTGSLTAPGVEGDYELRATNVFANVIKQGEDGNPFWATEAAGVGTVTNLTITVGLPACSYSSSDPAGALPGDPLVSTLPRLTGNILKLTFTCDLSSVPTAGEIEINELLDGGGFGADLSSSFGFAIDGGDPTVLVIEDTSNTLSNETWYAIRNIGGWTGVSNFEVQYAVVYGDSDDNARTDALDVNNIWLNRGDPSPPDSRQDVDANGRVDALDVNSAWLNRNSAAPAKPTAH